MYSFAGKRPSHIIRQATPLGLAVLEMTGLFVKFQVKTDVGTHELQGFIDGHVNAVNLAGIRNSRVHLEHLSESRIGIGTGAAAECRCA